VIKRKAKNDLNQLLLISQIMKNGLMVDLLTAPRPISKKPFRGAKIRQILQS
jgi:hypothetical protein